MGNSYAKRIQWGLILGVICGISCWAIGKYVVGLPFGWNNLIFIIINRAVLGFVVAISAFKLKWYYRGPLIGVIVGSILTYSDYMAGYPVMVIFSVTFLSLLYGLLIDFFISVVLEKQ